MSQENNENQWVETRLRKRCLEIHIQRPERKNALNLAMYGALSAAVTAAVDDPAVRVLLLTGTDTIFTSGNDLEDFAQGSGFAQADNPILHFMKVLARCPKPVIVAVNGVAIGIGTTLLLHCDLVYAAPDSQFQLPFVPLGLCPEYASSWLLPRLVGPVKANEWLLLGQPISAQEAQTAGLVNAVVEDPQGKAREQADALAQMPPAAVRRTKALLREPLQAALDEVMEKEAETFAMALQGEEFGEAVSAFFDKRKPDFGRFE